MTKNSVFIGGVRCDDISLVDTVQECKEAITGDETFRISMVNARKVTMAARSTDLVSVLNSAALCGADGVSILWASRLLNRPITSGRVNGTDLMNCLLEVADAWSLPIYLLGATEEVLGLCVQEIESRFPNIRISGHRHGYDLSPQFDKEVAAILASEAKIVFIGIPSPQKEFLCHRLETAGLPAVIHGVGGSFDVLSGRITRAPLWMQRSGLEWAHRLLKEPRKMGPRLFKENFFLIWVILRERIKAYGSIFNSKKSSQ